jgi:hypothetical protein
MSETTVSQIYLQTTVVHVEAGNADVRPGTSRY